ncbi:MAG TPA: penicillin acylase family protein [Opitutaceae bacterium]
MIESSTTPHAPVKRPATRRLRLFGVAASVVIIVLLVVAARGWSRFRASLPILDGAQPLAGLGAPASLERDALGTVTIRAANRVDVARALGFAHGQDRFFQMDLSRRRAAGELAELFGQAALPLDREARVHGFRALADQVLTRLSKEERALLIAYTEGVNSGRAAQTAAPWEYLVLGLDPVRWRPEDCLLVVYAMTLDLQDETGHYELCLSAVRDTLGDSALAFFGALPGPDDAALDGSSAPLPPPPGPRLINLRKEATITHRDPSEIENQKSKIEDLSAPGSNGFALAGARTTSGAALLANDMHLNLNVPNTWYRARLEWPRFPKTPGAEPMSTLSPDTHYVTGITLPGLPFVIAGSNGHIAWGFTNAYTDNGDLVVLNLNPTAPELMYMRGTEILEFDRRAAQINVKDEDPATVESVWTVWGPIVGKTSRGRPLVHHWIMHDPAAVDLHLRNLETAKTADEAVAVAHRSRLPTQNLVVADRSGAVAWTIAGPLPKRVGLDGRLPVPWTFGDRGWEGFLPAGAVPVVRLAPDGAATLTLDGDTTPLPLSGQLWSANQRMLGGKALERLGDGGYEFVRRAAQLRDDLSALAQRDPNAAASASAETPAPAPATAPKSTPADLLGIQLDDRALWLAPWQQLLRATLTDAAVAQHDKRGELRDLVARWEGRASVESVSYRLVRAWRAHVARRALDPIFAPCLDVYPGFDFHVLPYEQSLRALLAQRPMHLLAPAYASWDDLLLAAADDVLAEFKERGIPLARATWGSRNTASIRHPFSSAMPGFLGRMLDMPADELPGDYGMPRVQRPDFGASNRFVVAPGHEDEGIFHMPAGQSGHPLSPYYRAGHAAWVRGEATPFLPGETQHTLTLTP